MARRRTVEEVPRRLAKSARASVPSSVSAGGTRAGTETRRRQRRRRRRSPSLTAETETRETAKANGPAKAGRYRRKNLEQRFAGAWGIVTVRFFAALRMTA